MGQFAATSTPRGQFLDRDNTRVFQIDQWEDEVMRELTANFKMKDLVVEIPDDKVTGGTYHQPKVGTLAVNQVVVGSPVSLQAYREDEFTMEFKRYMESSFAIHDVATLFLDYDLRSEYSAQVGLALSRDLDRWLMGYRAVLQKRGRHITSKAADGVTNAPLNQKALLAAKLAMDLDLVPETERVWVFSPSQHTSLLSITEFINNQYVNGSPTMTGEVGMLYGYPVLVNNAIKKNSLTGETVITGVDGTGARVTASRPSPGVAATGNVSPWFPNKNLNGDVNGAGQHTELTIADSIPLGAYTGMLVRKGWIKFGYKQRPKTETSREVAHLSDIVVTSTFFDAKVYRDENCILIHSYEAA